MTLLPAAVYAAAPRIVRQMDLTMPTRADIAYRDDYAYFLQPWKTGETGPEQFAREALEGAGPEAVIYADTTTVAPLLYVQEVKAVRPDVQIVTGIVRSAGAPCFDEAGLERLVETQRLYVTSDRQGYCPKVILERYELARAGVLWRVIEPAG
jgi:hypothetical protein